MSFSWCGLQSGVRYQWENFVKALTLARDGSFTEVKFGQHGTSNEHCFLEKPVADSEIKKKAHGTFSWHL